MKSSTNSHGITIAEIIPINKLLITLRNYTNKQIIDNIKSSSTNRSTV